MAQTTRTKKKTSKKVTSKPATKKQENYKERYEALQAQIDDVHRMLDAAECPPNCGTLNGRMVEFAKHWLKRCGPDGMTHPAVTARSMLRAAGEPLWPL